jgi:hemerythrin-like domain-containing protein
MMPTIVRPTSLTRRDWLGLAAALPWGVAGCATTEAGKEELEGAEPSPGEDLMQEHGVLRRTLCVYVESARRLESREPLDRGLIAAAARLVRRFVEDYHEASEERFVFPRLERLGVETQLVSTLRVQHARGRALTDELARLAGAQGSDAELARLLRAFTGMYERHAAFEETSLFPAFRRTFEQREYFELGEQFETAEHEQLGEGGFETAVTEVAELERALGIDDLARFSA